MTTERPVPENEIPENFNLSPQQKQQRPPPIVYLINYGIYLTSGILPSGQANYFDVIQDTDSPENNFPIPLGLPINSFYPSPADKNGNFTGTGLLATYPPWWTSVQPTGYPPELRYILGILRQSGIFNFDDLNGRFSNSRGCITIPFLTDVGTTVEITICSDDNPDFKQQGFNIFNPYVHYYPSNTAITSENKLEDYPVFIPYVSDYELAEPYDPYDVRRTKN